MDEEEVKAFVKQLFDEIIKTIKEISKQANAYIQGDFTKKYIQRLNNLTVIKRKKDEDKHISN